MIEKLIVELSHDSGGGYLVARKKRLQSVSDNLPHAVRFTDKNRASSNNRCCFQRQFDLKFRAKNGSKYPPPLSWDDSVVTIYVIHTSPVHGECSRHHHGKNVFKIISVREYHWPGTLEEDGKYRGKWGDSRRVD